MTPPGARFRDAVDRIGASGLETTLPGGWTAKEMLAHVAFWDEAVTPFVTMMFRGEPLPPGFHFGSGFEPEPDKWPAADIHNAREAAWARETTGDAVLSRLYSAHAALLATIVSVTNAEAAAHADYFSQPRDHYHEHARDLV